MPAIKDGQILQYRHLKKIMEGSGTCFQSPALKRNYV